MIKNYELNLSICFCILIVCIFSVDKSYAGQVLKDDVSIEFIKRYKFQKDRPVKSTQEAHELADKAIEKYAVRSAKDFISALSNTDTEEWYFTYNVIGENLAPGSDIIISVNKKTGEVAVSPTL